MDKSKLSVVNAAIIEDLKKELRLQGHYDTGELEDSLTSIIESVDNGLTMAATALGYISELEKGVSAANIDDKNIDIDKLAAWVQRKGLTEGEFIASPRGIAFAIIKKWKKEGKPSENSRQFSKTGEILNAVKTSFTNNESRYFGMIDEVVIADLDVQFHLAKDGVI